LPALPNAVIERVFREHGLPQAMQSDNGPPFGTPYGRFSTMSVVLMSLGVQPVFSRPGKPQDNGRHERVHRDLKADVLGHRGATLTEQQTFFDMFRHIYNVERPHEGIGQDRPAPFSIFVTPFPAQTSQARLSSSLGNAKGLRQRNAAMAFHAGVLIECLRRPHRGLRANRLRALATPFPSVHHWPIRREEQANHLSYGKAENASRFPLSHSSYHQQSGKHQPGHEWKGSTWSFTDCLRTANCELFTL